MTPAVNRRTSDVAGLLGVTLRALHVWRSAGLVRPAIVDHTCVYSEGDLRTVRMVRDLRAKHIGSAAIRRILRQAEKHDTGYLLIHGDRRRTHYAATQTSALRWATKAGHAVLLLDLA